MEGGDGESNVRNPAETLGGRGPDDGIGEVGPIHPFADGVRNVERIPTVASDRIAVAKGGAHEHVELTDQVRMVHPLECGREREHPGEVEVAVRKELERNPPAVAVDRRVHDPLTTSPPLLQVLDPVTKGVALRAGEPRSLLPAEIARPAHTNPWSRAPTTAASALSFVIGITNPALCILRQRS